MPCMYVDDNYPGVVYVVSRDIERKFVDHMTGEGAALGVTDDVPADWECKFVLDVREDQEYWGLVFY